MQQPPVREMSLYADIGEVRMEARAAGRVYFQIQKLIDTPDADLSAYRLQLQGVWHVAVVGDAPDKELAEELVDRARDGELV